MGFRIDKTWLNTLNTAVRKKDATDSVSALDDRTGSNNQNQKQNQNFSDEEEKEPPTREELEKAVLEMKSATSFTSTGIKAEIVNTKDGVQVQLNQPNGTAIRTMSAEEFMKMRRASILEASGRGNILDQKL